VKRTRTFNTGSPAFHYIKIKPDLYRGFVESEGFFIALPEKAVLDALYLASMGRYVLDASSLDLTKVDRVVLAELSLLYPPRVKKYFERLEGTGLEV
jgi:hypothetical protein